MMHTAVQCSLLDLIDVIGSVTETDAEVVAAVVYLVNSGKVRLCGSFAGARFTLPPLTATPPLPPLTATDSLKTLRRRNAVRRRAARAL